MGTRPVILLKERTDDFNNMPLEETLFWIERFSCHLASEIDFLKMYESEHVEEIRRLLNEDTIKRFKGVALSLKFPYENYLNHSDPNTKEILEQGLLVQSWSSLGSLLESTLQIFLAFYYRFYQRSEWYKWDKEAIAQIEKVLMGDFKSQLESIIEQNKIIGDTKGLTNDIKKSFLTKVKEILKHKIQLPKIERITLSDLIDFYFSENVIESNDYSKADLQIIRDYRNAIHAFQERRIGSWDEYNNYLKAVILLTIDMLSRLPSIPDAVPFPEWYVNDKTEITMQENRWFNYRLAVDIQQLKRS
ncbi:hypothetical protein BC351_33145 [Paenibacillus ferrarius]|uniref:Uncharacterized protein n=1 Tax=Paenibacillus ferrarius TaxID=1469647 RepID=A0A1V4HEI8_9BACL|nr:hypothetical protein [Paenibacillus ferrarius]OPH52181.1 hypothetical protein BC351_33145 [Paenibacillus ferrarius]